MICSWCSLPLDEALLDAAPRDPEPPVTGSPLYSLPKCILTPTSPDRPRWNACSWVDQVLSELRHYLAGEPFENEITEDYSKTIG